MYESERIRLNKYFEFSQSQTDDSSTISSNDLDFFEIKPVLD